MRQENIPSGQPEQIPFNFEGEKRIPYGDLTHNERVHIEEEALKTKKPGMPAHIRRQLAEEIVNKYEKGESGPKYHDHYIDDIDH